MFWNLLDVLLTPVLVLILCVINIIKPIKVSGAFFIKGSKKNENTWNYTQRFYSWFYIGLNAILFVLAYLWIRQVNAGELSWQIAKLYIVIVFVICLLLPIPFTMLALKQKFDAEGNFKSIK